VIFGLLLLCFGSAAQAAWFEAKSKHFMIYANGYPNDLQRFASELERFDQAVRFIRMMDDPELTDSNKLRVYVLKNEDAVGKLAGSKFVAGFYQPWPSEPAAFVPKISDLGIEWAKGMYLDQQAIFFHEYAHHLQLQYSNVAMPAWAIEGFAEFFATARLEKDGVIIGNPPQYRGWALFKHGGLPFEQIVGASYKGLKEDELEQVYGYGWLLMHYLTFEPKRAGQFNRYIAGIQKGMAPLDSAKSAFGDLSILEKELNRYKSGRLMGVKVPADKLVIGPIALRQLSAGEQAIMPVRMQSRRGVGSTSAPGVAAAARAAAAPYPNDPAVQDALAEAEFDARNYAAAEAAADRALAANPRHVRAMIYKGRSKMALAAQDPKKANWPEIRAWFTNANKLDTENAEPLSQYYQSYLAAGERPTKNAIDALEYAAVLAPQAVDIRMAAVHQLLIDGRTAEAKEMFAPAAFNPHAGQQWRDRAALVMAALIKGDAKAALSTLDAPVPEEKTPAAEPSKR
jgi:hypothetical protein